MRPEEIENLFHKARRLREAGRLDDALALFIRVAKLAPSWEMARMAVADTYSCLGRDEEAYRIYEAEIKLSPLDTGIYFNYAVCCVRGADPIRAAAVLSKAIRVAPEELEAHILLAYLFAEEHTLPTPGPMTDWIDDDAMLTDDVPDKNIEYLLYLGALAVGNQDKARGHLKALRRIDGDMAALLESWLYLPPTTKHSKPADVPGDWHTRNEPFLRALRKFSNKPDDENATTELAETLGVVLADTWLSTPRGIKPGSTPDDTDWLVVSFKEFNSIPLVLAFTNPEGAHVFIGEMDARVEILNGLDVLSDLAQAAELLVLSAMLNGDTELEIPSALVVDMNTPEPLIFNIGTIVQVMAHIALMHG